MALCHTLAMLQLGAMLSRALLLAILEQPGRAHVRPGIMALCHTLETRQLGAQLSRALLLAILELLGRAHV